MYDKAAVPEWYRRGADVGELLNAAAELDWTADTGGKIWHNSFGVKMKGNRHDTWRIIVVLLL